MQVGYCSRDEFIKLTPCPDTVVISFDPIDDYTKHGWKSLTEIQCEVLHVDKDTGSFSPIDIQAKTIARKVYPLIKGACKVLFKCQYGKTRSKVFAQGLAYSDMGDMQEVCHITVDGWQETEQFESGIFESRSMITFANYIDELDK